MASGYGCVGATLGGYVAMARAMVRWRWATDGEWVGAVVGKAAALKLLAAALGVVALSMALQPLLKLRWLGWILGRMGIGFFLDLFRSFLDLLFSPAVLAAFGASVLAQRGIRWLRRERPERLADPAGLHSTVMAPLAAFGFPAVAASFAVPALAEWLIPGYSSAVNYLSPLKLVEAWTFRAAAFAVVLATATYRRNRQQWFYQLFNIYILWCVLTATVWVTFLFLGHPRILRGFVGAPGTWFDLETGRWLAAALHSGILAAVCLAVLPSMWLRSSRRLEAILAEGKGVAPPPVAEGDGEGP